MDETTDTNSDPSAQGQNVDANSQGQSSQVPAGIQQRIDELTASYRGAERQMESMQQSMAQKDAYIAELVRGVMDRSQPQPEPVDIDPEQARVVSHLLTPLQKQIDQQMKQMQQSMLRMQAQFGAQQISVTAPQGTPPEVVKRAGELIASWQTKPELAHLANPDDALNFALGEHFRKQGGAANSSRQQLQQMNGAPQGMTGHAVPRSAGRARPGNFEDLSPEARIAILESEGAGDKTF